MEEAPEQLHKVSPDEGAWGRWWWGWSRGRCSTSTFHEVDIETQSHLDASVACVLGVVAVLVAPSAMDLVEFMAMRGRG